MVSLWKHWIVGKLFATVKISQLKLRAWITIRPFFHASLSLNNVRIMHSIWIKQTFAETAQTIWSNNAAKKKLKKLFFKALAEHFQVNSPGFWPLLSRSSSSNAANTADLARFPVRVVEGSSKSILIIQG